MPGPYSLGAVHGNTKSYATFETKPSGRNHDGSRDTGGGYERVRSYESVPTHYGQRRKKEVYVAVHRLCAVAWCYPDSWTVAEILADMDGTDVHHRDGVEWNNSEGNLELLDHAEHSSLTQAELRAVTADRKADVEAAEEQPISDHVPDVCPSCGSETEVLATSPGFQGRRCLDCAKSECGGETIEV